MNLKSSLWQRNADALAVPAAVVALSGMLGYSLAESLQRKMWVDELYSYYVVNQPTARDLLRSLLEGCDNSPPLYALIVHALKPWCGGGAFGLRVPATAGFITASAAVFVFVQRRLAGWYALAAMLIFARMTIYFAVEGRPYGLVLACSGIALLAWQAAAFSNIGGKRWPLVILGISLAASIALQYYAVFLLIPFLAAERTRWPSTFSPDWPVLLALLSAPAGLLLNWRFIQATQRFLPYFWEKPKFLDSKYFLHHGPTGYIELGVVLLLVLLVWVLRPWKRRGVQEGEQNGFRLPEWTLITTLVLMPYLVIAIAAVTTRIFQDRYVVWAAFGGAILAVAVPSYLFRAALWPAAVLCAIAVTLVGAKCVSNLRTPMLLYEGEPVKALLARVPSNHEPVVVSDHHVFLELSFYGDSSIRERLVFLASPDLERSYKKIDTGALLLSAMANRTNLPIVEYRRFLTTHPRFMITVGPTDAMWPEQLKLDGYDLVPIQSSPLAVIYEASARRR